MLRKAFYNLKFWSNFTMNRSNEKVIVVAGTTGVGKSQLSIQLAQQFNGEIINSDSMQMYRNIPIITNKHPIEERFGIPHHVMNHIKWDEEYYLHKFEEECLKAIEDIHSRGKVAIVVGGTHYYLQVLFEKRVNNEKRDLTKEESAIINSNDPELVYSTLVKHDPVVASKYHPNDVRRVQRMLEIFYTTGLKPSETFAKQENSLRYPTLFLWLYSKPEELMERLDNRVDVMMKNGGMEEINELYSYFVQNKFTMEQCENGVWQVIGFKEFLPWLLKDPNASLEESINKMKIKTRQYAKNQVKWIRKVLVPDINGEIYVLNATDLGNWDQLVGERSKSITEQFLNNQDITEPLAPTELEDMNFHQLVNKNKAEVDYTHYTCSVCKDQDDKELIAIGKDNWKIHIQSRRHRSNLRRGQKKKDYELYKSAKKG